jgi:hypothetical protein
VVVEAAVVKQGMELAVVAAAVEPVVIVILHVLIQIPQQQV